MQPLESLAILNKPAACKEAEHCRNSPSHSSAPRCNSCRLSPIAGTGVFMGVFPSEWHAVGKQKHPVLEKEKRDAKRQKASDRQKARKAKDPHRQAHLRAAARAERQTEQAIIKSTRNSGRINRDGDHVVGDNITLDTKLQSGAENPVVHLHELDKVRLDAKRNGKVVGALCIRNKAGRGVIVLDENDFALSLKLSGAGVRKV